MGELCGEWWGRNTVREGGREGGKEGKREEGWEGEGEGRRESEGELSEFAFGPKHVPGSKKYFINIVLPGPQDYYY